MVEDARSDPYTFVHVLCLLGGRHPFYLWFWRFVVVDDTHLFCRGVSLMMQPHPLSLRSNVTSEPRYKQMALLGSGKGEKSEVMLAIEL